jgi:hypothetical protein
MKFLEKFFADLDYAAAICLVLGLLLFAFMDGLKTIVEFFAPLGVLFGGRPFILGAANQPLIADVFFVLAGTFFALARIEGFWQNYHNLPLFAWTKPAAKPAKKVAADGFTPVAEVATEPLVTTIAEEPALTVAAEKPVSGWRTAWTFLTAKRTVDNLPTVAASSVSAASETAAAPESTRPVFTPPPAVEPVTRVGDAPPSPESEVFYHHEAEPPRPRHVEIYVPQEEAEENLERQATAKVRRRAEESSSQIPPEREEDLEASELLRAAQSREVGQGVLYDSNFDFAATPDFKSGFLVPSAPPVSDPDELISDPAEIEALVAENLRRAQADKASADDREQKTAFKDLTASKNSGLGDLPTIDDILNSEVDEAPSNTEIEDLWAEPKDEDEV